jgi:hypothetical protein
MRRNMFPRPERRKYAGSSKIRNLILHTEKVFDSIRFDLQLKNVFANMCDDTFRGIYSRNSKKIFIEGFVGVIGRKFDHSEDGRHCGGVNEMKSERSIEFSMKIIQTFLLSEF